MLPKYKKAPVVEVVASVQFQELKELAAAHIAGVWDAFGGKKVYPTYKEQPPLNDIPDPQATTGIMIEFSDKPQLARQWFMRENKAELIQVQRDRFIYNWQKETVGNEYPHYEKVIGAFFNNLKCLRGFLSKEKLPSPQIVKCELAYINVIPLSEVEKASSVLRDFVWSKGDRYLSEPQKVNIRLQFEVEKNHALAYMTIATAQKLSDGEMVLKMEMNVKGSPQSTDDQGLRDWFNASHEWIVRSFDDLISDEMQKKWERYYE